MLYATLQEAADLKSQAAWLRTIQNTDVAAINTAIVRRQLLLLLQLLYRSSFSSFCRDVEECTCCETACHRVQSINKTVLSF